jgi:hypothetical protein
METRSGFVQFISTNNQQRNDFLARSTKDLEDKSLDRFSNGLEALGDALQIPQLPSLIQQNITLFQTAQIEGKEETTKLSPASRIKAEEFVNRLIRIACVQLLDTSGNLHKEIVAAYKLNENSKYLSDKNAIRNHFIQGFVCELAMKITRSKEFTEAYGQWRSTDDQTAFTDRAIQQLVTQRRAIPEVIQQQVNQFRIDKYKVSLAEIFGPENPFNPLVTPERVLKSASLEFFVGDAIAARMIGLKKQIDALEKFDKPYHGSCISTVDKMLEEIKKIGTTEPVNWEKILRGLEILQKNNEKFIHDRGGKALFGAVLSKKEWELPSGEVTSSIDELKKIVQRLSQLYSKTSTLQIYRTANISPTAALTELKDKAPAVEPVGDVTKPATPSPTHNADLSPAAAGSRSPLNKDRDATAVNTDVSNDRGRTFRG